MAKNNDEITLSGGETVDADLFEDLESRLLDDDPSEFQETRLETRKENDEPTPFTSQTSFSARKAASVRHEERTERAQSVDEHYNAPIAPDYETWRENPDQYDMPGVDTIPEDELARRGRGFLQSAQGQGIVNEVDESSISGTKRGEFSAERDGDEFRTEVQADPQQQADFQAFGEGSVIAHETGHAVDFDAAGGENFKSRRAFFSRSDGDTYQQAIDLSERVRGTIDSGRAQYRQDERELIADSIASIALEPQAARREAPELVDAVGELIEPYAGDDDDSVFNF